MFQKGNRFWKKSKGFSGRKHSEYTKKLMKGPRESLQGENHPFWKGENVSLNKLHTWVSRRKIKPEKCECCGKIKKLDLASKGKYTRNPEDYEWICRRCHMTKDGRIKRMHLIVNRKAYKNRIRDSKGRWINKLNK